MNYYTQNGWAGDNYAETKNLDITEIAKLVKKEIKQHLPTAKVSARIERYAGGQSLNVIVTGKGLRNPNYDSDYAWEYNCNRVERAVNHDELVNYYTAQGQYAEDTAKAIINSYRVDDSDSMIDYFCTNFYGHVNVLEGE